MKKGLKNLERMWKEYLTKDEILILKSIRSEPDKYFRPHPNSELIERREC